MGDGPHARLAELGLTLPPPFAPVATYKAATQTGNRLYVSGQGPVWGTEIRFRGPLDADAVADAGREAARLTMLNILSHVEDAVGLDRVARALTVFGLVNARPGFAEAHDVIAAGAALLEQVFGAAGRPALSAITATSLPFDIAVEMDAVFEIAGDDPA